MSKLLQLKIVTPEKLILEELVEYVSLPTKEGEITILPNHIPLIAPLASGDIVAFVSGEHLPIAVVGGFVEVKNNEHGQTEVAVLADFAEHVSSLSDEVIEKAKSKAEELRKLAENKEIVDFEHFETELERSLTRVKIADKWKNKKYRK
jgi:F-type H+-transporting ATPase subunit epsilon